MTKLNKQLDKILKGAEEFEELFKTDRDKFNEMLRPHIAEPWQEKERCLKGKDAELEKELSEMTMDDGPYSAEREQFIKAAMHFQECIPKSMYTGEAFKGTVKELLCHGSIAFRCDSDLVNRVNVVLECLDKYSNRRDIEGAIVEFMRGTTTAKLCLPNREFRKLIFVFPLKVQSLFFEWSFPRDHCFCKGFFMNISRKRYFVYNGP